MEVHETEISVSDVKMGGAGETGAKNRIAGNEGELTSVLFLVAGDESLVRRPLERLQIIVDMGITVSGMEPLTGGAGEGGIQEIHFPARDGKNGEREEGTRNKST